MCEVYVPPGHPCAGQKTTLWLVLSFYLYIVPEWEESGLQIRSANVFTTEASHLPVIVFNDGLTADASVWRIILDKLLRDSLLFFGVKFIDDDMVNFRSSFTNLSWNPFGVGSLRLLVWVFCIKSPKLIWLDQIARIVGGEVLWAVGCPVLGVRCQYLLISVNPPTARVLPLP